MVDWTNLAEDVGGAALGGVGGFLVGGPMGAIAGAGLGYQIGKSLNDEGPSGALSADQIATLNQAKEQQRDLFNEGQAQLKALQNPSGDYGNALGMLSSAASGNAPSQAQILMGEGLSETEGSMMGAAAGNNGVSPALALRNAMLSAGKVALQGVSQSAALRAAEMSSARNSYMTALQQNQQMQTQLITGQAGTAAQMAGQAGSSATQLSMPGVQTNAQTGQLILGGTLNTIGNLTSNNALLGGGKTSTAAGSGSGYFGSGMSQDQFFQKYGSGSNSATPDSSGGGAGGW